MNSGFSPGSVVAVQSEAFVNHASGALMMGLGNSKRVLAVLVCATATSSALAHAADTTPAAMLRAYADQAGRPGDAVRGEQFFSARHGSQWSCSSCHGSPPVTQGKHASTGKPIPTLAPTFNEQAFTRSTKTEKWFRRNCQDVLGRPCSAAEKADVLAYLSGLK